LVLIAPDQNGVAMKNQYEWKRKSKNCIPVLDAVLRSSWKVMALNILPVPAQSLDCLDKYFVL
jgi:hypothetical protein